MAAINPRYVYYGSPGLALSGRNQLEASPRFADRNSKMLVILYRRGEGTLSPTHYYSLDDRQQNLFNPFTLTITWGKHPEGGRQKQYVFASLKEKNLFVRKLLVQKLRTYKVLYSYFKDQQGNGSRNDDSRGAASEAGLFRQA